LQFLGWAVLAVFFFLPAAALARCAGIGVRGAAEVGDAGVSLADLLTVESCPALRQAAAAVWLGNSPLPGGTRVFEGSEIRRAIQELTMATNLDASVADANVPQRIVARRAGAKASCREIEAFVSRALRMQTQVAAPQAARRESDGFQNFPAGLDCGRAGRVPQAAPLELIRVFWDPALRTWEYSLRCVRSSDCVPFLVRPASYAAESKAAASATGFASRRERPQPAAVPPVVQVGQAATLLWEQDGIRAMVPVTCLDHGAIGTVIRARTKNGNRILRAEVVSAGILRAAL
jgi:hypothetical protein